MQDGVDGEAAPDGARQERAHDDTGGEHAGQQPDHAAREPLALPDDHNAEQQAEGGEVQQAVQEGGRAQEGLSPGERRALPAARWRAEPGSRSRSSWKRRPHEQERDRRAGIGAGVGQEGEGAPGFEERPAQRRPDDAHGRRPAALRARRLGQLLGRDDGSQCARLRGVEDGGADALDERHARR